MRRRDATPRELGGKLTSLARVEHSGSMSPTQAFALGDFGDVDDDDEKLENEAETVLAGAQTALQKAQTWLCRADSRWPRRR